VGIRETLNKNPSITTGVTIGIIVVALIAIIWQAMGNSPNLKPPRLYYTTDEGKNWFDEEANKIPPFDHNGGQAVRVYVYKCGPDGKPFAAFLERYTADAAKKLNELSKGGTDDPMAIEQIQTTGVEVKKVGGPKWVLRNTAEGEKIANDIKCPDGKTDNIEPVAPEN
jgi:hypothetical protein